MKDSLPRSIPSAFLSEYSTFHLGGRCRTLFECKTKEQLVQVINELAVQDEPFVLLGGGSNILVSDQGVDAVVVRYASEEPCITCKDASLEVSGATSLDSLVQYAVDHGLEGINFCSGIPGTVGGAIVGNAGAWGQQMADVLESVELLGRKGALHCEIPETLGFTYRHSSLKEREEIVVSARIMVHPGDARALAEEREETLAKRAERHPDLSVDPCIGSFFRNIEPTSAAGRRQAAGWFLEEAGAKRMSVGGARVFEKHANIIVAGEGCTAADVRLLAEQMAAAVKEKFNLDLVREVRYLGGAKGTLGYY